MGELAQDIGSLSSGKAEGLEGVTNDMHMNTWSTAREMLLDLFNNLEEASLVIVKLAI